LLFHPYFSETLLATFLGEGREISVIANPLFVWQPAISGIRVLSGRNACSHPLSAVLLVLTSYARQFPRFATFPHAGYRQRPVLASVEFAGVRFGTSHEADPRSCVDKNDVCTTVPGRRFSRRVGTLAHAAGSVPRRAEDTRSGVKSAHLTTGKMPNVYKLALVNRDWHLMCY
jgi:hypothetical protein